MSSNKKKLIIATTLIFAVLVLIIHGLEYLYAFEFEMLMYFNIAIILAGMLVLIEEVLLLKEEKSEEADDSQPHDESKWNIVKEKEDFFTLWAHQIKTPIAAMNLLIQADNTDLSLYKMELFKIEEYVGTALNYLRFEGMSNDLRLEDTDLKAMVNQTVKKYRNIFINKHLAVNMDNLDISILTDEKWFQFILEQILSNALKYTENGSVSFIGESDGELVRLIIKDTGIGIKAEDIPRLFEKGFTGFNGRMDKKASGLGLYLVKGVADKLGHKIEIESEENVGTSVIITILKERVVRNDLTIS